MTERTAEAKLSTVGPESSTDSEVRTVDLPARPISMERIVEYTRGPGGIPVIREIIIVQTEASASRVFHILGGLLIYALVLQFIIFAWQKCHKKSCKALVFLVLWLFPPIYAAANKDVFFPLLCLAYTATISKTILEISKRPMKKDVPRKTYKLFRYIFSAASIITVIGQLIVMAAFFLNLAPTLAFGMTVLFLSLYFGLLSREVIEVLSEVMATKMGYYSSDGVPERATKKGVCAICDESFTSTAEKTHTLHCGHSFHEFCVKGWCFIGKKGFCPCCREHVDFRSIPVDRWQKGELFFSSLLDVLRSAIVFCMFVFLVAIWYRLRRG
jgi:RING finger protein 121